MLFFDDMVIQVEIMNIISKYSSVRYTLTIINIAHKT